MTTKVIRLTEEPKFDPGTVVATPGFTNKVDPDYAFAALGRHLVGDWGILDRHDWAANETALVDGARLFSVYPLPDEGGDFWVITEWDRSVTTLLLPEEY